MQPPQTVPPELAHAIQRAENQNVSRHAKSAIPGYCAIVAFMPLMVASGVNRWSPVIGLTGFAALLAFAAWNLVRKPERSFVEMVLYACANVAMLIMLSRLAGPFTFVPALGVYLTFTIMTYPAFMDHPFVLGVIMAGGFLLPIVLEWLDVLPRTWEMVDGGLLSRSGAIDVSDASSGIIVLAASLVTIVMAARQSAVLARANRNNQHALVAQAWHLAQLLPRVAPKRQTSMPPA